MDQSAKKFFQQVLETPSPSGYEEPVQRLVREYAGAFADEVRTDLHGNVIACVNPGQPLRLMFAGHCDQIGLLGGIAAPGISRQRNWRNVRILDKSIRYFESKTMPY